jgi:hypothetical protein
MYRVSFYRPSASGELPRLETVATPSASCALALWAAVRAWGCKPRLWGKDGALWR